jgi:hypothetical protein
MKDTLEYFQEITIDGLVDVCSKQDISEQIRKPVKSLYHYNGPVTIFNKVFTRINCYIQAYSDDQALFLLKQKFIKEHPTTNNARRSWFDKKYITVER